MKNDIAPEHHDMPALLDFSVYLFEEVDIHPCNAFLSNSRRAASAAVGILQLHGFVASNVYVSGSEARHQLVVQSRDKLQTVRIARIEGVRTRDHEIVESFHARTATFPFVVVDKPITASQACFAS